MTARIVEISSCALKRERLARYSFDGDGMVFTLQGQLVVSGMPLHFTDGRIIAAGVPTVRIMIHISSL